MLANDLQSQTNAVVNNKLQGTVVRYLRCAGNVSNHIKIGLLLSLPVVEFLINLLLQIY